MTDLRKITQSKIVILLCQFALLSGFIYGFGRFFTIQFDGGIHPVQQFAIQFLANYFLFEGTEELIFVYFIWTIALLIPVFAFQNSRKALFSVLTLFILLNFFFYVFLSRYSPLYYSGRSQELITKTAFLGVYISILSACFPQITKRFFKSKEDQIKDLQKIDFKETYRCPHCGTEFKSLPLYCYNCLEKIVGKKGL
ncbi:MAG: hypothetical protein JW891_08370 [Candidatus Lokiarchaeota archaeon]|nr:hypothetical protein [Candidatus Lokiarchaeota archaeon]